MANNKEKKQLNDARWETIDLNRVRVLCCVLERGSFTAAAADLGLPKSSVSKAIAHLEATLGVSLIQRTSRSLRATETGRKLYETARPAIERLRDAVRSATSDVAEPRGLVRLSCPPDLDDVVGGYVARFRQAHPQVSVDVSLTSRNVDLIAEGVDLALRGGDLRDSGLMARVALRTDFALFAAPSYLRVHGRPRRTSDLQGHACIGVNVTHGRVAWTLGRYRVSVACAVSTNDMRLAVRLVCAGAGIALLPSITAEKHVAAGTLERVLPTLAVEGVTLRLVSPTRGPESAAVRAFREGLLQVLGA